ncbi:sensor domain-containing diguanylate cyclase [Paractinoplanes brasiliensis]|nr:sensor domain-containing diguanylate cyclase [Actinoplanes brasiliensis]
MEITSVPRRATAAGVVVLAVALVAAVGFYLAGTQAGTRARILGEFDSRARLAAQVIGGTMAGSDPKTREWAVTTFAGSPAQLGPALDAGRSGIAWLVVLRADGTVLGTAPRSMTARAATFDAEPGFQMALTTGRLTYGNVTIEDGTPMVYGFQPYDVGGETRVLVVPAPVVELASILRGALDVTAGQVYVADGTGAVVAGSDTTAAGQPIPDSVLAAARERLGSGLTGDRHHLTLPVAGSTWRMVIATSQPALLAPVHAANRAAWLIFGGFAATVAVILLAGAVILTGSARLARTRLHDALTGLPGRALLLEEAGKSIAQGGPLAVLFLDLDGFKPVNDTYGHAAGDALLVQVAQRLRAATRPQDVAARFGGDEFVLLCRGMTGADAYAVADRIRHDLSRPYAVDGRTVNIGVSIGLATPGPDTPDAAALIRHADLALYRAKGAGRGRIERFAPEPATRANTERIR